MGTIIKPTIGRIVWYYPHAEMAQPHAAIVAHVWSDTCVNLACFDANGCQYSKTSVLLVQGDMIGPGADYCTWMPYQKAQQAKANIDKQM